MDTHIERANALAERLAISLALNEAINRIETISPEALQDVAWEAIALAIQEQHEPIAEA